MREVCPQRNSLSLPQVSYTPNRTPPSDTSGHRVLGCPQPGHPAAPRGVPRSAWFRHHSPGDGIRAYRLRAQSQRPPPTSDGSRPLLSNPATHPRPRNPSSGSVNGPSGSQNSGKIVFQFIKGAVKDAGARSGEEMPRARPGRVLGTRAPVRAELGTSPLAAWT